jgi:hypothetical protein
LQRSEAANGVIKCLLGSRRRGTALATRGLRPGARPVGLESGEWVSVPWLADRKASFPKLNNDPALLSIGAGRLSFYLCYVWRRTATYLGNMAYCKADAGWERKSLNQHLGVFNNMGGMTSESH